MKVTLLSVTCSGFAADVLFVVVRRDFVRVLLAAAAGVLAVLVAVASARSRHLGDHPHLPPHLRGRHPLDEVRREKPELSILDAVEPPLLRVGVPAVDHGQDVALAEAQGALVPGMAEKNREGKHTNKILF